MKTKTILEICGLIAAASTLFGIMYQWYIDEKDWDKIQSDWEVMDKDRLLQDEYFELSSNFSNEKISKEEHLSNLRSLDNKFTKHIDEIDNRFWKEDAMSYRKFIVADHELIKKKIQYYESVK